MDKIPQKIGVAYIRESTEEQDKGFYLKLKKKAFGNMPKETI